MRTIYVTSEDSARIKTKGITRVTLADGRIAVTGTEAAIERFLTAFHADTTIKSVQPLLFGPQKR